VIQRPALFKVHTSAVTLTEKISGAQRFKAGTQGLYMLILLMYKTLTKKFSVVVLAALFSLGFATTQSGGTSPEFVVTQSGGTSPGILDEFWLESPSGLSSSSGLETEAYRDMQFLIEGIDKDAIAIGLTEKSIQTRVELRLLESNLQPTNANTDPNFGRPYLYVRVNVLSNAFEVNVSFKRQMYFDASPNFYQTSGATTWDVSTLGTHGGNDGSSAYIVNILDGLLDEFLRDYLTANLSQN
jgi:hypothetical protein